MTVSVGMGWSMLGNPYNIPVRVTGADAIDTYDPGVGYQQTDVLQGGRGAFVYSFQGGTVTLTPVC